jgi:hypothetical protein
MDDEDEGDNRDDKSINTHEPSQTDPLDCIGDYGPPAQNKDGPRGGGVGNGSNRGKTGGGNIAVMQLRPPLRTIPAPGCPTTKTVSSNHNTMTTVAVSTATTDCTTMTSTMVDSPERTALVLRR